MSLAPCVDNWQTIRERVIYQGRDIARPGCCCCGSKHENGGPPWGEHGGPPGARWRRGATLHGDGDPLWVPIVAATVPPGLSRLGVGEIGELLLFGLALAVLDGRGLGVAAAARRLLGALDEINGRFGRFTAVPAVQGFKREWKLKAEMKSPAWTTRIEEVPKVSCR
ncbi:MAG: DUF4113 domain-containing protein [Sphingomonadales bacterium]|nr:DUF4113 domain-containing protein [Sphingomonadales bacterium]